MTLPGVEVSISERRPSQFAAPDTATWMVAGYFDRGPIDRAVLVTSLVQAAQYIGPRSATNQTVYDSLDVYFREGGQVAYLSRIVGPAPVVATNNLLNAGNTATLRVDALYPGAFGNDIKIDCTLTSGSFVLVVKYLDIVVETSPTLADEAEAVAWASDSEWIRLTDVGTASDPKTQSNLALASGTDDHLNATSTQIDAALARFTRDYGPGIVSMPGFTAASAHEAVLSHCNEHLRVAYLDSADIASAATFSASAQDLRDEDGHEYGGTFWPWAKVDGIAAGTTRTVPYSAVEAGITAREEARGSTVGDPIAGVHGESLTATGLSQDPLSDADREIAASAGVNVVRIVRGAVRTYDYVSLANQITDKAWVPLTAARVMTAIAHKAFEVGEAYFAAKLDGKGRKVADFGSEIEGRACLPFYTSGDLYGERPDQAFRVDVGPGVNTPETVAADQLKAVIAARPSPFGREVEIEVRNTPTTESV